MLNLLSESGAVFAVRTAVGLIFAVVFARIAPGQEPPELNLQSAAGETSQRSPEPALPQFEEPESDRRTPDPVRKIRAAQPPIEPLRLIEFDTSPQPFWSGPIPRTPGVIGDASLNAVCCVGRQCWAVGERGVVLHSSDSGTSWASAVVPYECSLQSVCFLTDRIGWMAGTRHSFTTSRAQAVLLQTRDGGATWLDLVDNAQQSRMAASGVSESAACSILDLSAILKIEFFGLENGFAVTQPCERFQGSSLFRTADGGMTWAAVPAEGAQSVWTAGAFLSESEGIVAGERLCHATVVSDRAVVIGQPLPTFRRIRGLSVQQDGSAWLAGDGGFLLRSTNAGITWNTVLPELPGRPDQLMDFHTIAHREDVIVVGGTPGSAVLRSEDAGRSWAVVPTGLHGSVRHIIFAGAQSALAVGTYGAVLKSDDAGRSWLSVRSGGFRSGLLNLVTELDHASWSLLANESGDSGVRSTVAQLSPQLPILDSETPSGEQLTSLQALTQTGGNDIATEWMFTRNRPEHSRAKNQLIESWNRQTDGELRRLLPLRVARLIRIWQPTVIVVESLSVDDEVASITRDVLPAAMRLAASAGPHDPLASLFLEPWTVQRVLARSSSDQTTGLAFRSSELLPNLGTTSGLLIDFITQHVEFTSASAPSDRVSYEVIQQFDNSDSQVSELVSVPSVFASIRGGVGSGAKRAVEYRSRDEAAILNKTALAAQIESAALEGHLRTSAAEDALTAEIRGIGSQLPPALALQQLRDLAELQRRSDNLNGLLSTLQEITRRFPDSEDAQRAAESLFLYYSSAEIRRYRLDQIERRRRKSSDLRTAVNSSLHQDQSAPPIALPEIRQASAVGFSDATQDVTASLMRNWDLLAVEAMSVLQRRSGAQDISPPLMLRLAANLRRDNRSGEQSSLLAQLTARGGPESVFAAAEAQVAYGAATPPLPVINLRKTPVRPLLDSQLTDSCWEQADEVFLMTEQAGSGATFRDPQGRTLIMMSWDDEFLFITGRIPRLTGGPPRLPLAIDRDHDAVHLSRDRIEFELDPDRDYVTSYAFSIDQTGQTSERCWTQQDWNPEWYAAVDDDAESWRFEVAMPLKSLDLGQTKAGDLWGIRLQRVVPGYVRQSLSVENDAAGSGAASAPNISGRGLIRFIRTQKK